MHVLLLSADSTVVPHVARRAHAAVYDLSHTALNNIKALAGPDVTIHDTVFPDANAEFDAAMLLVPKGRDFARAQLWSAYQALKPGGVLYIAGPTKGGAKSVISDAEVIFGNARTITYKKSHRIGAAIKPEAHTRTTYPADWGDDPTHTQTRTLSTPQGELQIVTMPGVFSWQSLDEGTQFLLENVDFATFPADAHLLDVGCGYGIIGALAAPHVERVVMVDDSLLAVRCARETIALNNISNAQALAANVYVDTPPGKFDIIISNPPFHRKFQVSTNVAGRLIQGAPERLSARGRLILVANGFLTYSKQMDPLFKSVREIARDNRYMVIEGQR